MKKRMAAFIIDLYLVQIFLCLTLVYMPKPISISPDYKLPIFAYFFIISIVLSVLLACINIIHAIKRRKDKNINFKIVLIFKLCLIPFFIINFLMWLIFALATANPLMAILWVIYPIGIAFTYMVLLVSSSFSISQITVLRRDGIFTTKQSVCYIILQLIYVVDVIHCFYIYRKLKS